MTDARYDVVDIEVRRAESVRITYADGVVLDLPVAELRAVCPCAGCRGRRERGDAVRPAPDISVVDAQLVGAWGIGLHWSDGHDVGIYSWETMRDWWDAGRAGPLEGRR
jgi:DUF971 family protein